MMLALLIILATPHTFTVPGLTCPTCEDPVRRALALTEGVSKVGVDWRNQAVTVEFDEDVTSLGALAEVLKATGFPAVDAATRKVAKHVADVDWIRPKGGLKAHLLADKATVFAFTTTDCAPCDVLKRDLSVLAQRVARVAVRFIKLEGQDDPLYGLLPKNPAVPYALVYGPDGQLEYRGTPAGQGALYRAIEEALGVNPNGSPIEEDAP